MAKARYEVKQRQGFDNGLVIFSSDNESSAISYCRGAGVKSEVIDTYPMFSKTVFRNY
jgi:hypothetical protein